MPHGNLNNVLKTNTYQPSKPSTNALNALFNVRSLSNKTFILNDSISSASLDVVFLTESWLQTTDYSQLELCPPHCGCLNQPRVSDCRGGIACVYRKSFKCHKIT